MTEHLHDARRTYTFYVDDAVLDVFGPRLGAYALAVYMLLARHAKQKEAFPSYATISKKLGMSRRGVINAIRTLVEVGLVKKGTRTSDYGDPSSNLYTLVDLSQYHDHPPRDEWGSAQDAPPSAQDAPPSAQDAPPSVSQTPPGAQDASGVVHMVHQGSAYGAPPLEGISLKGSQGRERENLPLSSPPTEEPSLPSLTPNWLMLLYNQATPRGHPKVRTLSPARREKAAKYLRIFPDAVFWDTVMQEVSTSAFLLGRKPSAGHEGFVADFDWLLTKGKDGTENCLKVAEGKYRDGPLDGFSPAQRRNILAAQRAWEKEREDDDAGAVSEVFDMARNARRRLRGPSGAGPPAGVLGSDA